MWIFSKFGFYSIASARKTDNSIDPRRVMVRARNPEHLENLKKRFPKQLNGNVVIVTPDADYQWRVIVEKNVWANILADLAKEQLWSNFKAEAAKSSDPEYAHALHEIWEVMLHYGVRANAHRQSVGR